MKIKLDENLPAGLVDVLAELAHDVDTVLSEGAAGWNDESVLALAREADRFLITQDLDFADIRALSPGTHPGILVIRLREPGREALRKRIRAIFRDEDVCGWSGCFVIATEHKVRVRRP